jgi:acetylornithine/N-succinyldiaminopimelate aminotransferase
VPAGIVHLPYNDIEAARKAIGPKTCAVVVEPIQGEGGVIPADPAFLRALREACDRHGALLIFDEVQTGMGRLGPLFAFQRYGVQPDVVTLAKALANGLPIGAMLVREQFACGLQPGDHGSTFGGSPVPCAAALAHLRVRDELHLEDHVEKMWARLFTGLHDLAERFPLLYGEPRGVGLLAGLPVRHPQDAAAIVEHARVESNVLLNKAGNNTIRMAPPLVIGPSEIDRAIAALHAATTTLT